MSEVVQNLFWILVFPGFVFTVVCGLVASWIVRKVSALVHHRIGPPILQPLYDVIKLLGKETLIPEAAQKATFMASPLVGFAAVLLLATMLWRISFVPGSPFVGDIIVAIYLLVIPSLALILGSSASASPQASIGTAREMKLVVAYELPLVLAFLVVIIKTAGAVGVERQLSLAAIADGAPVLSISGMIAFLSALLCVQAKLGFIPFDMAEAETEIASGVFIEYSGALLAVWTLMQTVMLVALPLFLVVAFLGGFGAGVGGILAGVGKYVLVLVLIILIKNTNPRMRIDQAMKFFWFYCGTAMVVAVALAIVGSVFNIGWL
jgi:NADH-quinone oxidoreductase subunit H